MWAKITNDKIDEIITYPKTIIVDDVKHPASIFTNWSWTELNNIGIVQVEDTAKRGDANFQTTSVPTYTYNKSKKKVVTSYTISDLSLTDYELVDADGNAILDPDGNKIIVEGLKTKAKNEAKGKANELISRFSWLVERSIYDSSKTIPTAVSSYVSSIRQDCSDIETAVDNASDLDEFKALYTNTVNADGEITQINRINRWTDDDTVKEFIR